MISSRLIEDLAKRKEEISCGNKTGIKKQHDKGKLTARERIEVLLDEGSFEEFGMTMEHNCHDFGLAGKKAPGDGVIIGFGTIFGRPVCVFSQDFTVIGGSLGAVHAKKICTIQEKAIKLNIPIIGMQDSGGARIQEGIDALAGYGDIFQNNIDASGLIPQISVIMGPAAGGAVYSPALTDFIFMTADTSYMFVTGPEVIKTVTFEEVTMEQLGGGHVHSTKTGVCDCIYDNDFETLQQTRRLFSFLPLSTSSSVPVLDTSDSATRESLLLDHIVPNDPLRSYNMHDVIYAVIDEGDFFEVQPNYAKNIIIGFGRIMGSTIGLVVNQPNQLAGCLDISASRKAARFVRFCDAFNIPIVTFVDVPGFLPGTDQEHNGIIKHGAKLLYAYGEATVPKITIVTRKSYGGAYIVMGSKHLGGDLNYAWPNAEIAVMGSKGAVNILFRKHLDDKEFMAQKAKEYEDKFNNPYFAASKGFIDDIIRPRDTREKIYRGLLFLKNKNEPKRVKKHDNLPL